MYNIDKTISTKYSKYDIHWFIGYIHAQEGMYERTDTYSDSCRLIGTHNLRKSLTKGQCLTCTQLLQVQNYSHHWTNRRQTFQLDHILLLGSIHSLKVGTQLFKSCYIHFTISRCPWQTLHNI